MERIPESIRLIREQLEQHRANLRQLEREASVFVVGERPVRLLNQIAAEEKEIARLQAELDEFEARPKECPYRGLLAFHEEHAEFFFGRERLTERLVEKLTESRFLAVLGPSGLGKSSAVRAGLVPALRQGALPGSEHWPILTITPGERPLKELASHLAPLLGGDDPLRAMRNLEANLVEDESSLDYALSLALKERPEEGRAVLVVDQFEEIFTLCRDEEQRKQFIANLLHAGAIEGGRTVVVLTMRADFYGRCAVYRDLVTLMADHQVMVSPMDEGELRQAIEAPAHKVGLEFEAGLVEDILEDVGKEPGALPPLQHALLELWERQERGQLTHAAYQKIGQIQGAIAKRAEAIYESFEREKQAITRRIMLRLTQPGEGTEDTRRRAQKRELIPGEEKAEAVEEVVQALADARLVTTRRDMETGEEQVNVSHEALIRGWPRLQDWIDEDRAGLLTHRRLTEAAREWERLERDEGLLYRGARLAEAEEWAASHVEDMTPLEREFLQASIELRDREAREREARLFEELEKSKEREKQHIRSLFQRYVSPVVVDRLIAGLEEATLGGKRQEITTLFADIRGFIAFSERMSPEKLVEILNQYLSLAAEAVLEYEGTLDKFMGSEVMAFFNAPLPQEDHALRAVKAALDMQRRITEYHKSGGGPQLSYGVGINLGEAVVGNIGTAEQMNYTAIGDSVNLAKRLHEIAMAGQILMSQSTYQAVKEAIRARPLMPIQVRGRQAQEQVYELVGIRG